MDKKKIILVTGISLLVILCMLSIGISYIAFKDRNKVQQVIVKMESEYRVFIPLVPEKMEFCNEKVPLNDFDVHERVERELLVNTHWYSATIMMLKRANRWFPEIAQILRKNNIPDDFKYLAVIESGLANVVSPLGAAGFWQLIESTAKKYGLEVNREIDERYNLEKSTLAACAYLKEAYRKYGSWTMAAASYNYGLNGIDNQIGRQKTNNYYNLYLNEETYRFVARILAIKEIFTNSTKYGFNIKPDELYEKIETEEIIVRTSIKDLADFAAKSGINYKVLKIFNPWLRENYLPNKLKKSYVIKIPLGEDIELISN